MPSLMSTENVPAISKDLKNPENHWNNWPNEKGFDPEYEQPTPVELYVTGQIPVYAAGTLYRTGPGLSKVKTDDGKVLGLSHWFDGFSQTHRFQIIPPNENHASPKVLYNSRFSVDALREEVRKTGKLPSITFGQKPDPCKIVFDEVQTEFEAQSNSSDGPTDVQQPTSPSSGDQPPDPASVNIGVTLSINMPGFENPSENENHPAQRWADSKGIKSLWAKTDVNALKRLDPETLEPIEIATQANLHPALNGRWTAAHSRSDPLTGDVYNFNLSFDPTSTYRIFHVSASTSQTRILATFPGIPAYIHSINITQNYVILCVWNAHINDEKNNGESFIDSIMPTDPTQPATWYIVDRKGDQGLVAIYESVAFYAFHTIGAYEEPSKEDSSKVDVVADLVRFDSSECIRHSLYERLKSSLPTAKAHIESGDVLRSTFSRFRLPAVPSTPQSEPVEATLEWSVCKAHSPELPTMNPQYVTKKYRYIYAVGFASVSTFTDSIIKFDIDTQEEHLWRVHGHSPGEAIFVPNPDDEAEDDGVLLSVVLDGFKGTSYLLCLDARTLTELGRADVNGAVGFGFHGQHVPRMGFPTGDY